MKPNINSIDQMQNGLHTLIVVCGDLKPNEKGLVVVDCDTIQIGKLLVEYAHSLDLDLILEEVPRTEIHGIEPPKYVGKMFPKFDLVMGLTTMSMAHTNARLSASQHGTRYLSLPDYNTNVLTSNALQFNFRSLSRLCFELAERLTNSTELHLRSTSGSDFRCKLNGRRGNPAPGWCYDRGTLASPPDAETNIAPIEQSSEGYLVVDGSIPCDQLGVLNEPIRLTIKNGKVVAIEGGEAKLLNDIFASVGDDKAKVVAEIGIGLNPRAEIRGSMLEDEGSAGTAHVGIGANSTIGGVNGVPFHLDHIIREVSIDLDGVPVLIKGKLIDQISQLAPDLDL